MYALKRGMDRLENYYKLHVSRNRENRAKVSFEPSINAYLDQSGQLVKFKYISKMEANPACVTFLAETLAEEPRQIVAKFVERYCPDAHILLAAADMAPALYYYGKEGVQDDDPSYSGFKMIITGYIERSAGYDDWALSDSIVNQTKYALQMLHGNGYVYGDLRRSNILVTKEEQVKLVNFEMTGLDGKDCYPLGISPLVEWPDGVEGLSVMKIEHDLDMLNKMLAEPVGDVEMS
jgi:serine/threonine protein kinase